MTPLYPKEDFVLFISRPRWVSKVLSNPKIYMKIPLKFEFEQQEKNPQSLAKSIIVIVNMQDCCNEANNFTFM